MRRYVAQCDDSMDAHQFQTPRLNTSTSWAKGFSEGPLFAAVIVPTAKDSQDSLVQLTQRRKVLALYCLSQNDTKMPCDVSVSAI